MKLAIHLRILAALIFLVPGANAATIDLKVQAARTNLTIGTPVEITITVTNGSSVTLSPTIVRAEFSSAAFTVLSTSSSVPTNSINPGANPITVIPGLVTYQIDNFPAGQQYSFTLRLRPDLGGPQTVRFSANGQGQIATAELNFTSSSGEADLQVLLTSIPTYAIAYDQIRYQIIATNRGPSSAPNVVVTNFIPGGAPIIFNSAGTALTRPRTNQVTWNVGIITNSTARILTLTLQPTNSGTFPITASIFSANNLDSGTNNNFVSNNIVIQPTITNTVELTRGTRVFNRDIALIEETVTVKNISADAIPGARVLVQGLTASNYIFNVSGTNGILPFVAATNSLAAGQSVPIRIQYFFKDRTYKSNINLIAIQGPGPVTNQIGLTASNILITASNTIAFNFPSAPGRTYSIQSSDTLPFPTNPSVVVTTTASTSSVTLSDPLRTNIPQRFFRAIETR